MPESAVAAIGADAVATDGVAAVGGAAIGDATAAAAGSGVVGAIGAGSAALSAAAALRGATRKPPAPTQMPVLQNPTGEAAAAAIARRNAGAAGLSSTNLTGPQGLTAPATTAAKTLLGS